MKFLTYKSDNPSAHQFVLAEREREREREMTGPATNPSALGRFLPVSFLSEISHNA